MRPKTVASSDLARLLQHQRTSHWPRLWCLRRPHRAGVAWPSNRRGVRGHTSGLPRRHTPRRIRYASSELLARTSLNHVTATECWADARGPPEECGKAGLVKRGMAMDERWNEPSERGPAWTCAGREALRTGSALSGLALPSRGTGEARGSSTSLGTWPRCRQVSTRLESQSPGPARNDPALIRGGIGTASGVVTPSRRGQPVASALQRISCRCQIVVNIWDKRPLAATGVAVDRPPATQGTWRIGGRGRRV